MERYNITVKDNPFDGCPYADMVVSDDGAYMRYDDAQRALDAERERVKDAKDDCVRMVDLCKEVLLRAHFFMQYREQRKMEELESACVALNKPLKGLSAVAEEVLGERDRLRQQLATLQAQVKDEQQEVQRCYDLLWGMRCIYCNEVVGKDKQNQDVAEDVLKVHIHQCEKHPVFQLQAQLRQVEGERDRLKGDMKERFKTIDQLDSDLTTLRQLVEALPVVDGQEVSVWLSPDESGWLVSKRPAFQAGLYWAKFRTQAEADSFRSLLAYRATLAAPSPTEERHE